MSYIGGHIYYVRIYKYQTSTTQNGLQFYWPTSEQPWAGSDGNTVIKNSSFAANTWVRYSARSAAKSASGSQQFRIDLENSSKAVTAWYDGAILIDLTACFGSGKEPDIAWCDSNIPFFENNLVLPPYPLYTKVGSAWKAAETLYEKTNGVWQKIEESDYSSKLNNEKKYKTKYVWKANKIHDEHTKLLLHFDKLPYADEINSGVIITSTGNSKITPKGKFANAAVFPADASHYIEVEVPNLSTMLNTNKWTFDWWEYNLGFSNDSAVFILSDRGAYTMMASYYHSGNGGGKHFYASSNGSSWDVAVDVRVGDTIANQWIHRAIVRNNNSIKLFENGILVNEAISSATIKTTNNKIRFSNCWNNASIGLNGYIDEFRFSDVARWTDNFTPPTQRYLPIENLGYVYSDTYNAYNENNGDYYYERL